MKAIVFDRPGPPAVLELRDVPEPAPGAGEVLIDVRATALNRPDLLQRRGRYPAPPGASEVLGLECAGLVVALGPGVSALREGDRVMALLPGGGYAERAAVHERLTLPIPAGLGFAEAAAIPEVFLTAHEALFSIGRVSPGEWVLIHAAAGGVGSAAIQLAKARGARVVATAGGAQKCDFARGLGADRAVDYKSADFALETLEATQGRGADVILDFVGASYAEQHGRCLAPGGRQVILGLLGGARAEVDLARLLAKRQSLLGLIMRTRPLDEKIAVVEAFRRSFLPLFAEGRLRPVLDRVFPIGEVQRAHERMEANQNLGKIVLSFDE